MGEKRASAQRFDTCAVENVIDLVMKYNPEAIMVIKSTIPVGYTASVREKFHCDNIIFSTEFLRESKALYDNGYPQELVGWECGIRTRKYIKMNLKKCFCVEVFV